MLRYLKVATHITGDPRYEYACDQSVLIAKSNVGPGAGLSHWPRRLWRPHRPVAPARGCPRVRWRGLPAAPLPGAVPALHPRMSPRRASAGDLGRGGGAQQDVPHQARDKEEIPVVGSVMDQVHLLQPAEGAG